VGCVPTGIEYHAYLNPGRAMPPGAERVHGLSDAFLADKAAFDAVADELLEFLADSAVIAHNAAFDIGFLDCEFALSGRPLLGIGRSICTVALAKTRLPGAKHSLDALCSRFGIDRSVRVKHGALIDARLLAEVYIELIGGRQIGLALAPPPCAGPVAAARVAVAARAHAASKEELIAHAAFLATIERPLWLAA